MVEIRWKFAKDKNGKVVERVYPKSKRLWLEYNIRNKLAPKCKCGSDTEYFNIGKGGDGYYCLTSNKNHLVCDENTKSNKGDTTRE